MSPTARTALIGLLATLTSMLVPSRIQAQPPSPNSGFIPNARKGIFTVFNGSLDSARVEVSIGTSRSCPQGAAVRTITLQKGRAWSLRSATPLCYRYDASFDSRQPSWSTWRLRTVATQVAAADSI
jgi:hypothetical protein